MKTIVLKGFLSIGPISQELQDRARQFYAMNVMSNSWRMTTGGQIGCSDSCGALVYQLSVLMYDSMTIQLGFMSSVASVVLFPRKWQVGS